MTEQEWLNAKVPWALGWAEPINRRHRKRRLLGCAFARRVLIALPPNPCPLALIEACERYADATEAEETDLAKSAEAAWRTVRVTGRSWRDAPQRLGHRRSAYKALESLFYDNGDLFSCASEAVAACGLRPGGRAAEVKAQMDLIYDIFGNPFRPVSFSPEWRTDTAVALSRQLYDAREFSALPILADALQDAGCDNDDILSHCRDPNAQHVRGCWVTDLVLGKA